ncbi:hypothetical protein JZ751_006059 [Albula glossodonta]|uniref:Uncharacterized protein n=1 Tax=Albula glossodonta TaxID=121402 RepID=A0A8T2PBX8_9TELE|nr:hypothetical protein JZ751_006059 [Albula glossodonta]
MTVSAERKGTQLASCQSSEEKTGCGEQQECVTVLSASLREEVFVCARPCVRAFTPSSLGGGGANVDFHDSRKEGADRGAKKTTSGC